MRYRAIYLGNDQWVVRRFNDDGTTWEVQFIMHFDDPQLRSSDRKAIEHAQTLTNWRVL